MRLVPMGAAAAALLLAACSQIDHGNKLESLRFTSSTDASTPLLQQNIFDCFPQQLVLIGEFTDHSLGNFTTRGAVYTSSDTSKVRVSNGDIELADHSGFFARGVVLPVGLGGPAVITASFGSKVTSTAVTVNSVDSIVVTPAESYLAPGSSRLLKATAIFNGQPADVSGSGQWTIDTPNTTVAGIGAFNGLLTGGSTPGTVTARYSLPGCVGTTNPASNATATVHVAPVDHIDVARQFAPGSLLLLGTSPGILQTSEAITTTAHFFPAGPNDTPATQQDLSPQATLTLAPADTGTLLYQSSLPYLIRSLAEGPPVTVTSSFNSAGSLLTAQLADSITVKAATLVSVAIQAEDQNPVIPAFGTYAFRAIGSFVDANGAALPPQDITRHVAWTSSDASVVMSNVPTPPATPGGSGTATSTANQGICVTITADTRISGGADTIKGTTTLQVAPGAAATPPGPGRPPCTT